ESRHAWCSLGFGRGFRASPFGETRNPTWCRLEVELSDVLGVEAVWFPEHDGAVGTDGVAARVSCLERVALGTGALAGNERVRGVRGEVSQLLRVPQRELGNGAVLDVLPHLPRRAETGQRDLALRVRGRQVARSRGDTDGGRRHDALELRVGLQERGGLVE